MVYIYHGDDQNQSRAAFNKFLDSHSNAEILRLDAKEASVDVVNNFVNGQTLFATEKILAITNFFSITKATLDKILKVINNADTTLVIWQDKKLTATQTTQLPKAKVEVFTQSNQLFGCLNAIRPGNLRHFITLYHSMLEKEPYDLFFYLTKNSLRKQLTSYSKFSEVLLKFTYLQLIELEFQYKTGQLTTDKEIALERIITNLIVQSR